MVPKPKSINPGVFDSAMLKAKSIGAMLALSKEVQRIIMWSMIAAGAAAACAGLVYYFNHEIGNTLGPVIKAKCKEAFTESMLEKGKALFA